MNNLLIKNENFDKFIFKGSLALEAYFDNNHTGKEIFDDFNIKLRNYRQLAEKQETDKQKLVNELILIIEKFGIDKFIIYDDGDVEYIWK
mgnify:FL=1